MNEQFANQVKAVKESYSRRTIEETKVWDGFQQEVDGLTSRVSEEFSKLLDGLKLNTNNRWPPNRPVKIKAYQTSYDPQFNHLNIAITDWAIERDGREVTGGIPGGPCAYCCLESVTGWDEDKILPEIKKFREDYGVRQIRHECDCGSDHK